MRQGQVEVRPHETDGPPERAVLVQADQVLQAAQRGAVEEIKQKQRISGFNSIFCVASVPMAKLYYQEFKKQIRKL